MSIGSHTPELPRCVPAFSGELLELSKSPADWRKALHAPLFVDPDGIMIRAKDFVDTSTTQD